MKSFNILKEFKKDMDKAILNDIEISRTKKMAIKNIFLFIGFLGIFVVAKPMFIYYKGYYERLEKIRQLKKDGNFVLDTEEENK
jgi:hypothetical protein